MLDVEPVQHLEPLHNLDEHPPDLILGELLVVLGQIGDFLEEIPLAGELHDDSELWMAYMRESLASSMKASLYPMMLGCLMEARIRTSFKAFCFYFSLRCSNLTFFMAYSSPSVTLLTLYTEE